MHTFFTKPCCMETPKDCSELMTYIKNLSHASCELKSKLTTLILSVEESEGLSANEKNCILNIAQLISSKNQELISAENQLKKVMGLLFNGSSEGRKRSYALLEDHI